MPSIGDGIESLSKFNGHKRIGNYAEGFIKRLEAHEKIANTEVSDLKESKSITVTDSEEDLITDLVYDLKNFLLNKDLQRLISIKVDDLSFGDAIYQALIGITAEKPLYSKSLINTDEPIPSELMIPLGTDRYQFDIRDLVMAMANQKQRQAETNPTHPFINPFTNLPLIPQDILAIQLKARQVLVDKLIPVDEVTQFTANLDTYIDPPPPAPPMAPVVPLIRHGLFPPPPIPISPLSDREQEIIEDLNAIPPEKWSGSARYVLNNFHTFNTHLRARIVNAIHELPEDKYPCIEAAFVFILPVSILGVGVYGCFKVADTTLGIEISTLLGTLILMALSAMILDAAFKSLRVELNANAQENADVRAVERVIQRNAAEFLPTIDNQRLATTLNLIQGIAFSAHTRRVVDNFDRLTPAQKAMIVLAVEGRNISYFEKNLKVAKAASCLPWLVLVGGLGGSSYGIYKTFVDHDTFFHCLTPLVTIFIAYLLYEMLSNPRASAERASIVQAVEETIQGNVLLPHERQVVAAI